MKQPPRGARGAGEVELFGSRCGKRLLRRVWAKPGLSGGEVRGGIVLVHGLGDHTGRYDDVAAIFVERGFVVAGVDFPGNGGSEGRRGVMSGVGEAHLVMDELVEWLKHRVSGSICGMVAHSMGGFLGLLYVLKRPGLFRFCWVNGALADPAWGKGLWLQWIAKSLGSVCPGLTVGNGVKSSMCSHLPGERDPLTHRRVSIGLGASLMCAARELREAIGGMEAELNLLATHGGGDPVCPPEITRQLIESAGAAEKRFVVFPGMLHETFRDVGAERLFAEVASWLDGMGYTVVLPSVSGAAAEQSRNRLPG